MKAALNLVTEWLTMYEIRGTLIDCLPLLFMGMIPPLVGKFKSLQLTRGV